MAQALIREWRASEILGGAAALYLASVCFIHWVNRGSLENRVAIARLGMASALILLTVFGSALSPAVFSELLALGLLLLAAFATVRPGRLEEAKGNCQT